MAFPLVTLADLGPYEIGLEGKHARIQLNRSNEQLEPILGMLEADSRHNYSDLDSDELRAFSGMLYCALADALTTDAGVSLSRAKTYYAETPARYRDESETYRLVIRAQELAERTGWITSTLGNKRQGKQTVIRATPKLKDRGAGLIDLTERPAGPAEVIILRDLDDKSPTDYDDIEHTRRMRRDQQEINAGQSTQTWVMDGKPYTPQPARRIFVGSFERGGRMYHPGQSHQNCKKAVRETIQFVTADGEVVETAEWDAPQLHIRAAYALASVTLPEGDLYDLGEGFDRKLAKIAVNAMFCAPSANVDRAAAWSLAKTMAENNVPDPRPGRTPLGDHDPDDVYVPESDIYRCLPKAGTYIKAIRRKHPGIAHLFGTDLGAQLQVLDSNAMVHLSLRLKRETGVVPLCNHDSVRTLAHLIPLVEQLAERIYRTEIRKFRVKAQGRYQALLGDQAQQSGEQRKPEGQGAPGEPVGPVRMEVVETTPTVLISVSTPPDSTSPLNNSLPPPQEWGRAPTRGSPPTPAPTTPASPGDGGCPLDPFTCPERYTPAEFMSALASRMACNE